MSSECICGEAVPCDLTCPKHGGVLHGYPCGACGREWEVANPRTHAAIARIAAGKGSQAAFVAAKRADAAGHASQRDYAAEHQAEPDPTEETT